MKMPLSLAAPALFLIATLQGCSYLKPEPNVTVGEGHRFVSTGDVPVAELQKRVTTRTCEAMILTAMPEGMPHLEVGICYATVPATDNAWNDALHAIDELHKCMCENAGINMLLLKELETQPVAEAAGSPKLLRAKAKVVFWGVQ